MLQLDSEKNWGVFLSFTVVKGVSREKPGGRNFKNIMELYLKEEGVRAVLIVRGEF